jgi:outer membrane murein-binding lipoprotein Lpp
MRILGVVSMLLIAGCVNPRSEAATAQALNDAANEINGLRQDMGQLQMDLDSLRQVVAKQDSAIAKITAQLPR